MDENVCVSDTNPAYLGTIKSVRPELVLAMDNGQQLMCGKYDGEMKVGQRFVLRSGETAS